MATMFPGVRPSISFASLPTASTSPVVLLIATMEGSFTTMPLPFAYTSVLAVPRSIAKSLENALKIDRRLWTRELLDWNPFPDMSFRLLPYYCVACSMNFRHTGACLCCRLLLFVCSGEWRGQERSYVGTRL